MFGAGDIKFIDENFLYLITSYLVLLILCIFASLPFGKMVYTKLGNTKAGGVLLTVAEPVCIVFMLVVSTAYLVDGSFNPLLYFRF